MHQIIFYPVGNGDCSQIILENGKRILLDYRHHPNGINPTEPEIDLAKTLKDDLKSVGRDNFDVVVFTHADNDHIEGSTEFFELEHAAKYQGDERIKIKELWVPAAMVVEKAEKDKLSEEFAIWGREARHRLKTGNGIKIFSKPDVLVEWMKNNNIDPALRANCFVDAGKVVNTFSLLTDEVEFFCHSPYMKHCDDNPDIKEIRNAASIIFNIRFSYQGRTYDLLATGDSECEVIADIVNITEYHGNSDRLKWDLFNIPHHCSYLALSNDKGDKKTTPTNEVEKLLLYGKKDAYMISSSKPIGDDKDAYDSIQPPHVQAKNCYVEYLGKIDGRKFLVTMEEPTMVNPKPLKFEISSGGLSLSKAATSGASRAASVVLPRAG